jgi:REP-associated tyrosine transposase
MARPLRIGYAGALYHVTSRGNERKPVYRDDRDRARFVERLAAVVDTHRLRLHAFALMRNHFHLLVETPEANLSRAMGQLNGSYTQDFNRRHRRSGHLFQGRYKAILVEKDSYLLELSRYIHLNPVRVGEVSRAWEFAWSSAAAYVGRAAVPEFLTVEDVLAHFGRRRAVARRRYAEFLADGAATKGDTPWRLVEGQVLLGERAWVERMKRRLAGKRTQEDIVGRKSLQPRPTLSVVLTQVCRASKVDRDTVLRRRGGRGGWARAAAMALAWEVGGLGQREIGRAFGVGPHAVSKAIAQTAALRREGGKAGRALARLTSILKG